MNDKVIEILIHLLGHLKENDLDFDSLNDFSDGLVTRGFDENEIVEAIQWFIDKINSRTVMATDVLEQQKGSVRILHDFERMSIAPETYGYLLKLKSLGVLTGSQMEKILDYFLLMNPRAYSETDINEVIADVIFEEHLSD